ncbi:MAG: ABC transporter permease [Tepidisphaerales bacterium]
MTRVFTWSPNPDAVNSAAPRSFYAAAVRQTLSQWGARLGLLWLGFLAILAVFGPLIASSHPYWVRLSPAAAELAGAGSRLPGPVGVGFSPLWRSLTPVDVALLAGTLTCGVVWLGLWLAGVRRRGRLVLLATVVAVIGGAVAGYVKGRPAVVVYERYRELQASGVVEYVLRAPIPYSPSDRNRDTVRARQQPPTWALSPQRAAERPANAPYFLLGSDREGSDVASRLIHASRTALAIGFVATGIATVIGVIIGGLMGYFAGWLDIVGMRLIEMIEAVPRLMLLLAVAAIFNADIFLMMVLIGLTGWMGNARFIRAEFLRLRKQDFVQAAEALGLPLHSILFKHLLPNGIAPVLVSVSFGVAGAILIESTLAFLGIGRPDQPSWGQLLNQAREGGEFQWWIAVFPGGMIFLTVFAYQLIGEALRDALDPKLKKRE